ncbi:MAG: PQQ-binding-like beta-propeller repeat protein [bacterium]
MHKYQCKTVHILFIMAISYFAAAMAPVSENWPHWRGPDHNGISNEKNLPATWSRNENIKWRLELPGSAPSTPVIWNERIFLTSAEDNKMVLLCVSTNGNILWKKPLGDRRTRFHQGDSHTGAPSPSTDGKHVWAFTGQGILACFDFAGQEIWRTDLQERYNRFSMYHGMSTTPLLYGDCLYIQLIHDNAQLVLALDKTSGNELWKHNRKTDARMENLHSYTSPVIYRHGGLAQLIVHGADYVTAHNLKSGDEIWRCGGLQDSGRYNDYLRFVASPVVATGLVVVPSAKNGPVLGLKPEGAKGDITQNKSQYHWKLKSGTTDVPTPLIHEGLVYICRENGILLCVDAKTGVLVYRESVYRRRHRASPVYADGKIFLTAADGTVNVIRPGRKYALLATNSLNETLLASPAISNGSIYLRTYEALYAIGKK